MAAAPYRYTSKEDDPDLYDALEDTMDELAAQIQYEAFMDDRGFGRPGDDDEYPEDEARFEALDELEEAVIHNDVDELVDDNNLPHEAAGFSRYFIIDLLHELREDYGGEHSRVFEDSEGAYRMKRRKGGTVSKFLPPGHPHFYRWRGPR